MAHAQRLCDRLAIIAGGKRRFEGTVDEARGMLPSHVVYHPHHAGEGLESVLPVDAAREGEAWRFALPAEGIEPVLTRLIDRGYGIAGLSIERPGLHEAFVRIVGPEAIGAGAGEGSGMSARPMSPARKALRPDADHRAARFRRDGVHPRLPAVPGSRR